MPQVDRRTAIQAGLSLAKLDLMPRADGQSPGPGEEMRPAASRSFDGVVQEHGTMRRIAGAKVLVRRRLYGRDAVDPPAPTGTDVPHSDSRGRFKVTFTPEQMSDSQLLIEIEVSHPEYIARRSSPVALSDVLEGLDGGPDGRPFFASISLEKGVEYTARVVTPAGKPAADVECFIVNWTWSERTSDFQDQNVVRTNSDGILRFRTSRSQSLALYLKPKQHALFQRFWGTDRPGQHPDIYVPTDLGTLILESGVSLTGVVLDLKDRPLANQTIVATTFNGTASRSATTDATGRFQFAPLRPGNYLLYGEGQSKFVGHNPDDRPMPSTARLIRPVHHYIDGSRPLESLTLREMPTVRVEVRFRDSSDRPAPGNAVKLSGVLTESNKDSLQGISIYPGASSINEVEARVDGVELRWNVQNVPDADGLVTFRAPKGLKDATLWTFPVGANTSFKTQLTRGASPRIGGGGSLDTLDADRTDIVIRSRRCPVVVASVIPEAGERPRGLRLGFSFTVDKRTYIGKDFVLQPDGRFLSAGLVPDQEMAITVYADDFEPSKTVVKLPEGAVRELALRAGPRKPSWDFLGLDGKGHLIDDYRGKYILFLRWQVRDESLANDLASLEDVDDCYGADPRLVLIGLCDEHYNRRADGTFVQQTIEERLQSIREDLAGRDLPHLRAGTVNPWRRLKVVEKQGETTGIGWGVSLFGPDGIEIASDLMGDRIKEAVSRALGLP
ncbi:Nickel uptake substrate-specific transmembrane region [Aquisphaera giovannonii]|uniref:Nickel uptake substrate-specific transmembrane region n=1 Tax=Aquisphaera giovannonii TaxID=406548 RepID=A0A5B9W828_9BACT|nr:carboxypeptidase-like regulatory domain-containing protein [Aquisphaera giovannonii]QEH36846.1 Nickel uptake substrate-specific transmembrane region [Aquisphaera giovannonii]